MSNLPPDIEIRLISAATGLRLAFDPDVLLSVSWELQESGGIAQVNAEIAVPFETLPAGNGDILEVWALNTGETVPRGRAIVNTPERGLDLKETHKLIAFGLMEDMEHVLLDMIEVRPGGADVSVYAAMILDTYQNYRGITIARDIRFIGVSLEQLTATDTTARAATDQLQAQAGRNLVWGWDIEPGTGLSRFYFRPRVSTIGYEWQIGDNVRMVSAPRELAPVTNAVKIIGGPARYPNLIPNSSFEVPQLPTANSGSLLGDGSFEAGNVWTGINGVQRSQTSRAHTGQWYGVFTGSTQEYWQECSVTTITVPYLASLYVARDNGSGTPPAGRLVIEGRTSGGSVNETYTLPLSAPSTNWTGGNGSTVLSNDLLQLPVTFTNATTTKARVRLICDTGSAGHGLLIDDVTFGPASGVGQYAWSTYLQVAGDSRNQILYTDWASKSAAKDGRYGVRLSVIGQSGYEPALTPYPGNDSTVQGFQAKPNSTQSLNNFVWVRMAPGLNSASGQVRLSYRDWVESGKRENQYFNTVATIPNDGAWHKVSLSVTASVTIIFANLQVSFLANGVYDVDSFSMRDSAADTGEYLRGTTYERYVDVEDAALASLLSVDALASISTYQRREAPLSNQDIVDWTADSRVVIAAYFNRAAVLLQRPRVQIDNEFTQTPDPGTGLQVRISGTTNDIPDTWPAKVTYTWARQRLSVSLEQDSERPTWAKLLTALKGKAANSSSTAQMASSAAGRGAGGGGGATSSSASVASNTNSGTVKTDINETDPVVVTKTTFDALVIPSMVFGETPTGAMDGVNATFTLAHTPLSGIALFLKALGRLRDSVDYTISGNTITMTVAPTTGDWLLTDYVH